MPALKTHGQVKLDPNRVRLDGKVYYKARYYKDGKLIGILNRFRKTSLLLWTKHKFETGKIDKAYLKVVYSKDNYNDGYYENMEDFITAYEIFSSQELINYING